MPPSALAVIVTRAVVFALAIPLYAIEYPSAPQAPVVPEVKADSAGKPPRGQKNNPTKKKVPMASMRLRIQLGDKSVLVAEAALPATYSFTHKKGQIQYNQTVRAEEIRSLTIESYRAHRVAGGKEGDVYEFEPADVRIELKDGQTFRLKYLFKDLRQIRAHNADGNFSVFAFFADTYDAKRGWQERTGEKFSRTTHNPHPAAFVRLEYFEPVDKAGNAADDPVAK